MAEERAAFEDQRARCVTHPANEGSHGLFDGGPGQLELGAPECCGGRKRLSRGLSFLRPGENGNLIY